MTFISAGFYLLLLITIILYFITPLRFRWFILLAGSIAFYITQGIEMLPFILAAAVIVWFAGIIIEGTYKKDLVTDESLDPKELKKQNMMAQRKRAKLFCSIGVIILVAVLAFIKMARYAPETIAKSVIVPVGISYYTFSLISYIVDVYWRKQAAEHNILKFTLFVCFFPKILQGPISRYKTLGPQLIEGHTFDYQRFCFGLQLLLWGLFKKLVIADRLTIFTSAVFVDAEKRPGSIILVGAIFAAFELYCDFSGCMDMARGISQIFGIELEKNFDHPFFSKSAAEFWRRWHITLGTWFKDYIYMPMVTAPWMAKILQKTKKRFGTRVGKSMMTVIPLTAVWLLTGIWHGTGLPYVVWGIYWGAIIMATQIWAPEIKKLVTFLHINTEAESYKIFQMVRTFMLFVIGRIITIPGNLKHSCMILKNIVLHFDAHHLVDHSLFDFGLNAPNFWLIIFMLILLWCVSMLQEKGSLRERVAGYNIVVRWIILYAVIVALLIFGIYGPGYEASSFMYMGY